MQRFATFAFMLLLCGGLCVLCAQDTKENAEFKLAVNLYNSGMYDLAADQFQNFINAYPATASSIEARFYLGLTQMKLKRFEEARVTFQNFALTYTDNAKAPEAWMHVGNAYAELKNNREAASAYERLKVFHPNSPLAPEALLKAAVFYRKAEAKENARKALRTITQDYASSKSVPAARLAMGELYIEEGRNDLAQAEFSRVAETAPEPAAKARATLLLGKLYLSIGRVEEAEVLFHRVVTNFKSTPSLPAAAFELGTLLQQSGKYQEAIDQFRKAFADTSAERSVRERSLAEMGNSYAVLEDLSAALKQYKRFLTSFPTSELVPMIQYRAGRVAARDGEYDVALKYFEKVISYQTEGEPSTAETETYKRKSLLAGAESAVRIKDYAVAVNLYASFVDRYSTDPSAAEILLRLGSLYEHQLKDFRRAAGLYGDVLFKYPRAAQVDDALFAIARCRENLGDVEGALSAYAEVVQHYPSSEFVPEAKKRSEFLRNHKAINRDVGLEKLTSLIAEMISSADKSELAFKLGEIYFHDLKDYRSAAKQFDAAITGSTDEDQLIDASFYHARSYHMLAEIDESAASIVPSLYDEFLKQYPQSTWSDDAAFYGLQLKSKESNNGLMKPAEGGWSERAADFLSTYPESPHRPEGLLLLARAQGKLNNSQAVKSLDALISEFPKSNFAEEAWVELGKIYEALTVLDSTVLCWNNAVTRFPRGTHTAEILWRLGGIKMEQHKPSEAIGLYRRIASEHFYSSFADSTDVLLGDAYLADQRYDEAISLFQSLWDRSQSSPLHDQSDPSFLLKLGNAYNRKGQRQKAVALYQAYLGYDRRGSAAGEVYLYLGLIARDQGNVASAAEYFKQAAVLSGGEQLAPDIADLLFQTEQYNDAVKQYLILARSTDDQSKKQYYQLRSIVGKLRLKDLKSAQPLMTEFAKTYKKSEEALAEIEYEKGLYYYRAQGYPGAKKILEKVVDDYEDTRFAAWAEYYLGKILEATNKTQDAVKKFESILKRYPKSDVHARVYLSLGNAKYNAEKYQDAITFYQRIVESPETAGDILPYAMDNLIDAYEAVRLYDAALKVTRDFIDRFPNDPSLMDKRIDIGVLYTRLGYYDQAIVHFQHLLDEVGSDLEAEIHYDIGEAYYYKGDYQQAILEFLKVPYLVTKQGKVNWTATSLYMAGQSYEKMSKFDQALAMYRQIIDRPGIDGTFKAAAKKEIDRVKTILRKGSR